MARQLPVGWVCPKCGNTYPIQPFKLACAPECNSGHSTIKMKESTPS